MVINVESHAKAWCLLKALAGYKIVAKYDMIPLWITKTITQPSLGRAFPESLFGAHDTTTN
jgi:hypothetical protein